MNKIKIVNDEINNVELNNNIEYLFLSDERYSIKTLKLIIKEDSDLKIDIEAKVESTIKVDITVLENIRCSISEYIIGVRLKLSNNYNLNSNSDLIIRKIDNIDSIKEHDIFNLNGSKAKVKRVLKTISNGYEKYDMVVNHNDINTSSDLVNHGVNIDNGELIFNVSSIVPSDKDDCCVNQSNRIINLTNNRCTINPNMYIDCYNVIANHSAFIGAFKDEELFYLQSRGIRYVDATKLLIKGFLTSKLTEEEVKLYNKIIELYWR